MSDVTVNWGFALSKRTSMEKRDHHCMSDLAETLRRTMLSRFFTAVKGD